MPAAGAGDQDLSRTPRKVPVLQGAYEEKQEAKAGLGIGVGGTYGLGGSPHPKELWAPPCQESAVTRAASWAELHTVSEPLIPHQQQGAVACPRGSQRAQVPFFRSGPQ